MKAFKTSKEIVNNFSRKFNEMVEIYSNLDENQILSVFDAWEKVIGNQKLAAHCELYDIKNDIAFIKTEHSGWSQQILIQKKIILYNFKKFYPALNVKRLSVFVDSQYKLNPIINDSQREYQHKNSFEETNIENDKELENNCKTEEVIKQIPPELSKALKALKKAILKKNK